MSGCNSIFLCRICLEDGATIPIFGAEENGIHHKLCLCLNETIEDKYGYPKNICDLCQSTVNIVYNFIEKFQHTCQVLEERLGMLVKEEDIKIKVELFEEQNLSAIEFGNAQDITKLETLMKKENNETINFDNKTLKEENSNKSCDEEEFIWNEDVECTANLFETSHKSKKRKMVIVKKDSQAELDKKTTRKKRNQKKVSQLVSDNKNTPKKGIVGRTKVCPPTVKRLSNLNKTKKQNIESADPPKAQKPNQPPHRLCDFCGMVFETQEKLKWHRNIVHLKTGSTTCSICQKVFSSIRCMNIHVDRLHSDKLREKSFVCDTCSNAFYVKSDLNRHIREVHTDKKRAEYFCKVCSKKFSTAKYLLIHERSVHTGERPAVCTVCGTSFFHEEYLKPHMRLHTGETPFKCPVCQRAYAQVCNMKSHLRNHRVSDLDPELLEKIKPSYLKHMKA